MTAQAAAPLTNDVPIAGRTVLVADDDPILSESMKMALESFGAAKVLLAADGNIAHRTLRDNFGDVSLVVLDLRMPNEDGVGFLKLASDLGYKGKIIVISGERPEVLKSAERLARLYGLDCIGAYRKPFHPGLMLEVLLSAKSDRKPIDASFAVDQELVLREVHFQPKMDMVTGRCIGAEALSRFSNGFGHPLNTEHAILTAEKNGMIEKLTWQMIDKVLDSACAIRDEVGHSMKFAFNASSHVAATSGFAARLRTTVEARGLKTSDFTVELTETQIAQNMAVALENLTKLRIADFGVALDDFGTGHANIEQLSAFPFTELKIDKRFTLRAEQDRFAATCVEAAVSIGKSLDLKLVAEGVENDWANDYMASLGVDEAQGYYYSGPIPADEFAQFIMRHS